MRAFLLEVPQNFQFKENLARKVSEQVYVVTTFWPILYMNFWGFSEHENSHNFTLHHPIEVVNPSF